MSTPLEAINNGSSSNAPATITALKGTSRTGSTANSAAVTQGAFGSSSEQFQEEKKVQRRVLRPRTKPKSYAEPPDIVLKQSQLIAPVSLALPAHSSKRRSSGGTPLSIIKHITADTPTSTIIGQSALKMSPPHFMLPGGATLTVCSSQATPNQQHHHSQQQQQDDHCESVLQSFSYLSDLTITPSVTITPKFHHPARAIAPVPPLPQQGTDQQKQQYNYLKNERNAPSEEQQIPPQSQAAARMALCKQIEKTLLHVLPPKPPPPEMHFIPNPNNVEFVCLLGLETAVDYIQSRRRRGRTVTNMAKITPPFQCAQCTIDFTPAWKFVQQAIGTKDAKVICEQCVSTNVKNALKAEHTDSLKKAFVKALQREQEIEQCLANNQQSGSSPVDSYAYSSTTSTSYPSTLQQQQPVQLSHHHHYQQQHQKCVENELQQAPFCNRNDKFSNAASCQLAATVPYPQQHGLNLAKLSSLANASPTAAADLLQAFQQQLFKAVGQNLTANTQCMSPLLHSYQMIVQMAQNAAFNKNNTTSPSTSSATNNQTDNWWDIQRAAELLWQYFLDIVPQPPDGQSSTSRAQDNRNT